MYILAINCGSQTLKYKLFNRSFEMIKKGGVSKIGFSQIKDHTQALKKAVEEIGGLVKQIQIVGHRYVNGGNEFVKPEVIDKNDLDKLEQLNNIAPLHNPHNLAGIIATQKQLPKAQNVAVFDTAFYQDLPEVAWRYAINKKVADKYGYRRFGFHGISHEYVCNQAAKELKKELKKIKLISVHLGGGASITATRYGRAIDTSMGFTPLEGLAMMTRSGDLDPGLVIDLMNKGWKPAKIDNLLNQESGIFGICAQKDMLKVLKNLDKPLIKLAYDIYIYRIRKYLGAYYAVLNGCDAVIFTGSVGSGMPITRNRAVKNLKILNKVKILPIETNEELLIAQKAKQAFEK
ncbi:MAG: acetate/propionate family kinase [Candidatus Moranbacteria bacterium]|nr:acetate/propionate family kinase [Candidatus Moranbacteria bacterium]